MTEPSCCDFDDFVKAMADETRQRILTLLQAGEMSESDIVAQMMLTQPTISHHLSQLRRANPACVTECCGEILRRLQIS